LPLDVSLRPVPLSSIDLAQGSLSNDEGKKRSAIAQISKRTHMSQVINLAPMGGTSMNADERHLITDLFQRLKNYGAIEKDYEAEQLIISLARSHPDAGYMLVQNILVQEQVMQQQQQQIEDLQAQLAAAQRGGAGQARSGGFLGGAANSGGMFGGGRPAASVPPMGRPAPQPQYAPPPQQQSASPWGRTAAPAQPQYQQPAPQAAPAAGGGFMRSAMGMAAGVAGGMLAANAISNMMRGGQSGGANEPAAGGDLGNNDPGTYDASASEAPAEQGYADDSNNDPGTYTEDAASDTSWDGGGDVEL
jgi:uncharacterized protein